MRITSCNRRQTLLGQMFWFSAVGAVGFVVDAGTLNALAIGLKVNPYAARGGSFLVAASTTWILNRTLTFRSNRKASVREWWRYAVLMAFGAAINLSVFSATVFYLGTSQQIMLVGVALGTASAMMLNFSTARYVLLKESNTPLHPNGST
ncbi:MAG: GtrA family protein [Methylococcaceae bacterium]|jgi:putative flippase GtrA